MFVQGIPSNHIVNTTATRNKDYELEFINTDSNSDMYELKVFLRKFEDDHYKIRLILSSSILAYPALEMTWIFDLDEYEMASRVFHRVCDEVDDIKVHYDGSMMPASTLGAKIREAVKPISLNHQKKAHILWLDEAVRIAGESDWRKSIYYNRYPNYNKEQLTEIQKFDGKHTDSNEMPPLDPLDKDLLSKQMGV